MLYTKDNSLLVRPIFKEVFLVNSVIYQNKDPAYTTVAT